MNIRKRDTVMEHQSNPGFFLNAVIIAVVILLGAGQVLGASRLEQSYTPYAWQAETVDWIGDQDQNGIDDRIDAMAPADTVDLIVNFNDCVEDDDLTDLSTLITPGEIEYEFRYLSSVAVTGVLVQQVATIADRDNVAFIELQGLFEPLLRTSVPTICATTDPASGCLGSAAGLGYTGSHVNIAIMDTGVDDEVHETFGASQFQDGYNMFTDAFGNPDDTHGHGTLVASIALGQGGTAVYPGVAPAANLYDIKCIPGTTAEVSRTLEIVYQQHEELIWRVDVINGSFGDHNVSHDGTESFAQLIDLGAVLGILFVASAGNDGIIGLSNPAAATRALTVAASYDNETVSRADDILWPNSNRGKRANDGDDNVYDEMKPEVTAPGVSITGAAKNSMAGSTTGNGTSLSAPHVAGMAALIIQAKGSINVASLRDLIIGTAQGMAPASDPTNDPNWNDGWGWGLVNAYDALAVATATDISFPGLPYEKSWYSTDISFNPFPPQQGQNCVVTVDVENRGPWLAMGVHVHFGVHVYSASTTTFHDLGSRKMTLVNGEIQSTSINWTPQESGHQCMHVEIGYGPDTNYGNNKCHRNLGVTQSPVYFTVQNTATDGPALVTFETSFETPRDPQWSVNIVPSSQVLAPEDCPAEIEVHMFPPPGVTMGDSQIVHIRAMADTVEIGGVSILDIVESAVDVSPDLDSDMIVFGVDSYPNPFNPTVRLFYGMPARGRLTIEIHDLRGRLVRVLFDEVVAAGRGEVVWDGTGRSGRALGSGVYFYRARADGREDVGKIMLVR